MNINPLIKSHNIFHIRLIQNSHSTRTRDLDPHNLVSELLSIQKMDIATWNFNHWVLSLKFSSIGFTIYLPPTNLTLFLSSTFSLPCTPLTSHKSICWLNVSFWIIQNANYRLIYGQSHKCIIYHNNKKLYTVLLRWQWYLATKHWIILFSFFSQNS
jgi:hypothetical protein